MSPTRFGFAKARLKKLVGGQEFHHIRFLVFAGLCGIG